MELILLWLLGLLSIFSSVGSVDSGTSEPVPEPSATASNFVDPVQERFQGREVLPSCGSYVAGPGLLLGPEVRPGWRCLEKSVSGPGGEMVVYAERDDGIPVYRYVRVTPEGLMEIYVNDVGADPFAAWIYDSCSVDAASFRQGCP
jgi:hypothetical protein